MKKIYYVTFDIERRAFRETSEYIYHCMAENAKEAKEICKAEWPTLHNAYRAKIPHQFHLYAHASRIQDVDLLGCRTWKNVPIRGAECLGFICTGVRRWPNK